MLRFHYVVPPKRSCDSSTGQGERANFERPFVDGHLQDRVGLGHERWGEINKRFILFISINTW